MFAQKQFCVRKQRQNNLPPLMKRSVHLNTLMLSAARPDFTVLSFPQKPCSCLAVFRQRLSEQDVNGSSEIWQGRCHQGEEVEKQGEGLNRKPCIIYPKLKLIRSDSSLSPSSAAWIFNVIHWLKRAFANPVLDYPSGVDPSQSCRSEEDYG